MTRDEWDRSTKIHEGCGGICRWAEAIDRPGVGQHGECTACGATALPIEHMIPLEGVGVDTVREVDTTTLGGLSWDEDSSWDENQAQFEEVIAP